MDIYFCPFFKNARKSLQGPLLKNTLLPFCFVFKIFLKKVAANFFNIYYAENDLGEKLYSIICYTMLSKKSQKVAPKFICNECDYVCYKKCDYKKHCLTIKHNATHNGDNAIPHQFTCVCGNIYRHRPSYYRHKKSCIARIKNDLDLSGDHVTVQPSNVSQFDMSLVFELLKQNQEFKELMVEQSKQLADQQQQNQMLLEQQQQQIHDQHQHTTHFLEAVKDGKIGNNSYHNTTNNRFNLNLFLNETCKDAITMDDFIKSFEVTRDDFIHTGNVGFIEGISTVMLNRFRNMDMHTRPLHCTDLKRETVYIKNSDKWEKEDNNKTHLRKAVKVVAHRNMNELWRWYNDSKPEVEQIGSDECENYFKYYKAALGGCGKEEDIKFEDKIIKNVLKEVQVDKTALTVL